MKQLAKYLSTKPNKVKYKFPKNKNLKDIISFLDKNGFIEIERESETSDIETLDNNEELIDKPRYIVDYDYCISFCNSGKLSKENPVFECEFNESDEQQKYNYAIIWPVYKDNYTWNYFKSYKEFVNEVNRCFGW